MKVKELLARPEAWTKGVSARDCNGEPSNPASSATVSFCLLEAIDKCYPSGERMRVYNALYELLKDSGRGRSVVEFNDHPMTTHVDILALVNEADV